MTMLAINYQYLPTLQYEEALLSRIKPCKEQGTQWCGIVYVKVHMQESGSPDLNLIIVNVHHIRFFVNEGVLFSAPDKQFFRR